MARTSRDEHLGDEGDEEGRGLLMHGEVTAFVESGIPKMSRPFSRFPELHVQLAWDTCAFGDVPCSTGRACVCQ